MSGPKFTPELIASFLQHLAQHGRLARAANACGLTKQAVYRQIGRDPAFAAEVERTRSGARGSPKTAAEMTRETCTAILSDPEATHRAKLDATDQLRKLDAEERRQRRERGEGGDDAPAEGPAISSEVQATLREAAISAMISTLTMTAHVPGLEWSAGEWRAFAELERAEQEAVLAEAQDPRPLAPKGENGTAGALVKPAPAPAAVIRGMQMIIAGGSVDAARDALVRD